jgi:predicted phosphodiesterase
LAVRGTQDFASDAPVGPPRVRMPGSRRMRCLIVADLHYSLPQYDWVMQVADWFDVVIIAGDHLDLSSPVDIRAQSVVVRKYIDLLKAKTQLITCSGNHDLDARDADIRKAFSQILFQTAADQRSDR